jgi:hypothetical protein
MPVHSLHVFDRKGKVLFTKRYIKDGSTAAAQLSSSANNKDEAPTYAEQLAAEAADADQLKLVFGMLYSLREVAASLSGEEDGSGGGGGGGGLHSVRTGASTLYNYETVSGLRFALYVTGESTTNPSVQHASSIRQALGHVYHTLWIQSVTRSPLYRPTRPNVSATNFEQAVDAYLANQPWFR